MYIGIINAHMFGAESVPGEYVNWSEPDYFPESVWWDLGIEDVAVYAEQNPHMIVFVTEDESVIPGR